jgi:Cys-tRNA(Pro)/Cys-tRNA(Cys) deacylase
MRKNNVIRLLDQRKIKYQVYDLPDDKLGAEKTAELLGIPLETVYKTIVVRREGRGKPILAVVPGTSEVDLKALARAVGEKKVHLATHNEAEQITKLQTGGISPLALVNRGFSVLVDDSVKDHPEIHISGGVRGLNIRMDPTDLIHLTNAQTAKICRSIP